MNNFLEETLLYDFYSALLTEKQKTIFEMYYFNDFSLQEIGEIHEISRQAVRDLVKRTEHLLRQYEQKLGLLQKHREQQKNMESVIAKIDALVMISQEEHVRLQNIKKEIATIFEKTVYEMPPGEVIQDIDSE